MNGKTLWNLRCFFIQLLAGQNLVIINAHIRGEVYIPKGKTSLIAKSVFERCEPERSMSNE